MSVRVYGIRVHATRHRLGHMASSANRYPLSQMNGRRATTLLAAVAAATATAAQSLWPALAGGSNKHAVTAKRRKAPQSAAKPAGRESAE